MTNKNLLNAVISIIFILGHLVNYSNKGYVLFLSLFFFVSYLVNKNVILVVWHIFLTILPFQRGRYFLTFTVEKEYWRGDYPIYIEYYVRFTDLIIAVLLGLFFRLWIKDPQQVIFRIKAKKELIFLFLFLIFAAFAPFNATYGLYAYYQYSIFFILIILAFISAFIAKYKSSDLLVTTFFVHIVIISLLMLLQFKKGSLLGTELEQVSSMSPMGSFQLESGKRFRPGGYFFDPNAAGIWLIMSLPLWISMIYRTRRRKELNFLYLLGLQISLLAIILSQSRFTWIVTTLLLFFYFSLMQYRMLVKNMFVQHRKVFYAYVAVLILITPLIFIRLTDFSRTFSSGGGIEYRLGHYKLAFEYLKNNPMGIGLGMFRYEILGNFLPEQYSYDPTLPHNILLEVGVGAGVLGLISFCLFLYFNFKRQWLDWLRSKNSFSLAIFLSCMCYITVSQAYPYLMRSPLSDIFWMLVGVSFVNERKGLNNVETNN